MFQFLIFEINGKYCRILFLILCSNVLWFISSSFMYCPQLADFYGNVFSIRLGSEKLVFVSGYKMVKEAIITQAENFVDRPYSALADRLYSGPSGVKIFL